ncbi:hypothetical protein OESDEN_18687 [Oesophagostomum dentatum]|uniref:Uncharacterized protein n=1 Tax=Oesophagostomum dentatum TaxID=61180 RepID=A0A0B1SEM9_OESDE|nr:hypothetical protein OESDEN_18687 [Oesophagostomum dentatum]
MGGRRYDREISERQQLETEKRRLEFELEQERLALKDEEIGPKKNPRKFSRMLEEEKQKSEHMERVLAELQHKLGQRLDTVLEAETPDIEPQQQQDVQYEEPVQMVEENGNESNNCPEEDDEEIWKKDDFLMISTQSI